MFSRPVPWHSVALEFRMCMSLCGVTFVARWAFWSFICAYVCRCLCASEITRHGDLELRLCIKLTLVVNRSVATTCSSTVPMCDSFLSALLELSLIKAIIKDVETRDVDHLTLDSWLSLFEL